MNLSNTPHAWSPFFVVAIGHPDHLKWTVQFRNGELSDIRFDRSEDAEHHAKRMARFDASLRRV
jgi:hypothetical protein